MPALLSSEAKNQLNEWVQQCSPKVLTQLETAVDANSLATFISETGLTKEQVLVFIDKIAKEDENPRVLWAVEQFMINTLVSERTGEKIDLINIYFGMLNDLSGE